MRSAHEITFKSLRRGRLRCIQTGVIVRISQAKKYRLSEERKLAIQRRGSRQPVSFSQTTTHITPPPAPLLERKMIDSDGEIHCNRCGYVAVAGIGYYPIERHVVTCRCGKEYFVYR